MTPKRKNPTAAASRVSLREIARAAGVSVMAVSYALRGSAQVSSEERLRIQKLADEMGYRPDPLLTHLMQHLRSHRTLKSAANLAVLTMYDGGFVQRLLEGATARAERLGYHLDRIDARGSLRNPRALTRTLVARGVTGLLLGPADPASYAGLLDWGRFAVVAMTYSVVEPHVHRVVTHHFDNAVRTFALMQQKGFKRIGLAMTSDMEFRANHSYSAAYYRAAHVGGSTAFPVLLLDQCGRRGMREWHTRHRLDAVVVANSDQVRGLFLPNLVARSAAKTAFACLDLAPDDKVAGIDQMFEKIGAHAIDALVAQLHRNESGLPENPIATMVEGRWVDSCGFYPLAPS